MQASYFQAAWADIKHSPGWFGKICLLGLVSLIPIFGPIVVYGYAFGWARDMAWNVHRPMPERIFGNEDGKLYSRGFFAWLILLVVAGLIPGIVSSFAGDNAFWNAVAIVAELFLSIFAMVGVMRMAIYGRLSAGFQLGRMWSMAKHDAGGLMRILGMVLLVSIIGVLVIGFAFAIVIGIVVAVGIGAAGAGIDWMGLSYALNSGSIGSQSQLFNALQVVAPILGIMVVVVVAFVYALFVFDAWVTVLQARAMGYWTRQFDVARWRGQGDPMPFEMQGAPAQQYAEAQQQAQWSATQQQYAQPQQYAQAQQQPQQYQQGGYQQQPGQPQQQYAGQPQAQQPLQQYPAQEAGNSQGAGYPQGEGRPQETAFPQGANPQPQAQQPVQGPDERNQADEDGSGKPL